MTTGYLRGYRDALIEIVHKGTPPQDVYDISADALNQDDFDKGWQSAAIEKGAKPHE